MFPALPDWLWWVLSVLALVFVLLTLLLKFLNRKVRKALVAVMPTEIQFESIDAAELPGLNRDHLAQLTTDLEHLGFAWLRDYTVAWPGKPAPRGFARLFLHRQERCFAEIMATAQGIEKGSPFGVAINSYLDNDWDLGTSNLALKRGDHFMQLPKVLRMRYPGAAPAELLHRHLVRRKEMLDGLHLNIMFDLSVENYFARIRKRMAERRESLQHRQPLDELPTADVLAAQRSYEWLGAFPKECKRLKARELEATDAVKKL
jgi:hypothetical protein